MKAMLRITWLLLLCFSQVHAAATQDKDAQAAKALLEKALAYYHDNGDKAFAAFSRPSHHAGPGIKRDELPFLLRRETVDQAVAVDRRTHVHRHVSIFPNFSRSPLTRRLTQRKGVRALTSPRDDKMRAGPERRDNVLVPFVRERRGPKLLTRTSIKAHDRTFS